MDLHNSFTVAADIETAWQTLLDVPRIAPCMPGAQLTEVVDERHFKGQAKVRVGPVQLSFAGEAELIDIDAEAHTARLRAKGNDTKGRGAAQADVAFALVEDGAATRVDIVTDLNLTGSVAKHWGRKYASNGLAQNTTESNSRHRNRHEQLSCRPRRSPRSRGCCNEP